MRSGDIKAQLLVWSALKIKVLECRERAEKTLLNQTSNIKHLDLIYLFKLFSFIKINCLYI